MGRQGLLVRVLLGGFVLAALLSLFGPRTLVAALRGFRPAALLVVLLGTVWLARRAEVLYQTVRVSLPGTTRTTGETPFFSGFSSPACSLSVTWVGSPLRASS